MRSGSDPARERYRRFVADTMAKRIPLIIRNAEEGYDRETVARLQAIGRAVAANAPMVLDLANWPFAGWDDMPARVNGRRIADVPFFDFEFWMYFRILEAVRFPETRSDPFRATKHRDLDRHLKWADEALVRVTTLQQGLTTALDANSHDLSQISSPTGRYEVGRALLNIDPAGISRLNIIADNFGGELVADVLLAIVAADLGIETVIHVKQLPMFVSDVTADDITILFDRVGKDTEFGKRLQNGIQRGAIHFAANAFWSAPRFFDQMPITELKAGEGTLTIAKGDLNFRRMIGDVCVPVETRFQSLDLLPNAPILSLRSIKSYCAAGMDDWPQKLSKTDFPMDGSIVAVQQVPVRVTASDGSSSDGASLARRVRQWFRRGE